MLGKFDSLKRGLETFVANDISGQEFTWLNSLSRLIARRILYPVPKEFTSLELEGEYGNWNRYIQTFGEEINNIAYLLHFAKPLISNEEIIQAEAVIEQALIKYQDLKDRKKSSEVTEVENFHQEIQIMKRNIGLSTLFDELYLMVYPNS